MVVIGAEARKRREHQSVGECVVSDLQRLEELGLRNAAHVRRDVVCV